MFLKHLLTYLPAGSKFASDLFICTRGSGISKYLSCHSSRFPFVKSILNVNNLSRRQNWLTSSGYRRACIRYCWNIPSDAEVDSLISEADTVMVFMFLQEKCTAVLPEAVQRRGCNTHQQIQKHYWRNQFVQNIFIYCIYKLYCCIFHTISLKCDARRWYLNSPGIDSDRQKLRQGRQVQTFTPYNKGLENSVSYSQWDNEGSCRRK